MLQRRVGEAPIFLELKHSQTPKLTKGFWSAQKDIQPQACYVIYPGMTAYPLAESVEALPLTQIKKFWE